MVNEIKRTLKIELRDQKYDVRGGIHMKQEGDYRPRHRDKPLKTGGCPGS